MSETPSSTGTGMATGETSSAPDRIRTCDLWFRRPALYPTELRALTRGSAPDDDDCTKTGRLAGAGLGRELIEPFHILDLR
jgi:hypothetical protein